MYALQGYIGHQWVHVAESDSRYVLEHFAETDLSYDMIRLVDQSGNELERWL